MSLQGFKRALLGGVDHVAMVSNCPAVMVMPLNQYKNVLVRVGVETGVLVPYGDKLVIASTIPKEDNGPKRASKPKRKS